ncbi:hypothetical protein MCELHM10_03406 [Paracoccaceae bacterium]
MPETTESGLPLDIGTADSSGQGVRRLSRFKKRYLLILLLPVVMFSGAVIGMYFQPPLLRAFYGLTGLQPGGGSETPIALPPNLELPARMAETMLPTDVIGLARIMPKDDVSIVAAPYGAGGATRGLPRFWSPSARRSTRALCWRGWTMRWRWKVPC